MAKSSTFDSDILKLIFNATSITGLCDAPAATSPVTVLYCALHTADPTAGGTQSTNEISTAAYAAYARVPVNRNSGAWTVSGTSVSPVNPITWPLGTGGTGASATYMSVGVASSGATKILYSGILSSPIACGNGITPVVTTASTISEV